ncbi:MAG: hypothetical protein ABIO68_06095 [Sphingomicrobium sp.]
MRVPISPAAAALYRALVARSRAAREQVLLCAVRSSDWHSLTLTGEQHAINLKLTGPGSEASAKFLCDGLEDAEFVIPGQIVADIGLVSLPRVATDGSIEISLEALTIEE